MRPVAVRPMLALLAVLLPGGAWAHPHIWIAQHVRVIAKDGQYTHVELEWRFDPYSSEVEIPAIDEDGDGKVSDKESKLLIRDVGPEMAKIGFMTWLNTGAKDFRPGKPTAFTARIDDPASFTPPEWDSSAGDAPATKAQPAPAKRPSRNLVYVMRFALPQPAKVVSVTTYDPEDYVRVEVDKASLPAACKLGKHPSRKSEFVRGHPVFADQVSCRLP